MNKYELIINEKYNLIQNEEIDKLYVDLYLTNNSDIPMKKLQYIFSFFHWKLNILLYELNNRIKGSKYYLADYSRNLITIINDIFELITCLKNSIYEFKINKNYYFYLKHSLTFLRSSLGTQIPNNISTINIIKYEKIFTLINDENKYVQIDNSAKEVINKVANRTASFENLDIDEKIGYINMAIENVLKKNEKYINIDSNELFLGLISNEFIKNYRTLTNCFRHGSDEMINQKQKYTEKQKIYLINLGITICNVICNTPMNKI